MIEHPAGRRWLAVVIEGWTTLTWSVFLIATKAKETKKKLKQPEMVAWWAGRIQILIYKPNVVRQTRTCSSVAQFWSFKVNWSISSTELTVAAPAMIDCCRVSFNVLCSGKDLELLACNECSFELPLTFWHLKPIRSFLSNLWHQPGIFA